MGVVIGMVLVGSVKRLCRFAKNNNARSFHEKAGECQGCFSSSFL